MEVNEKRGDKIYLVLEKIYILNPLRVHNKTFNNYTTKSNKNQVSEKEGDGKWISQ